MSTARSAMSEMLDPSLAGMLVCPRDKLSLREAPGRVFCPSGHSYAVVEGIPILLLSETPQTHIEGTRSLEVAQLGEAAELPQFNVAAHEIDPFVQKAIAATNGSLYLHLVGKLTHYPIPKLRLPPGEGKFFLEIGCSWGRWCLAAARLGYRPVGIDPSLKGVRAARRVARQLGVDAQYVVADGRHLPFPDGTVDQVFSYSVLQHLPKEDVCATLREIGRVLRVGGQCQVQMANAFGVRCLYHQVRRRFREAKGFEVRYWTPRELLAGFRSALDAPQISVDGFFSLNVQPSDLRFLPRRYRMVVRISEGLRQLARVLRPLTYAADSLYVTARREA